MCSGIDPDANTRTIITAIREAAGNGAEMVFTPEMAPLLDRNRDRAKKHIVSEVNSDVIASIRQVSQENKVWTSLGSVPVLLDNGKFANRSLLIDDSGEIRGRYDKIHMFDVDLNCDESWRESNAYQAGDKAVVVSQTPLGRVGMTVCYDVRFPSLFEELGRQRCDVILTPSAFTVPTGEAHWHVLQRARAIEASAFVVAAAQVGKHADGRATFGHSLVIDPWGQVLLDMRDDIGLGYAELDLGRITEVRAQLPSLANRRDIPKSVER